MAKKHDILLVSFEYDDETEKGILIVGRRENSADLHRTTIINALTGAEAFAIYKTLTTVKDKKGE